MKISFDLPEEKKEKVMTFLKSESLSYKEAKPRKKMTKEERELKKKNRTKEEQEKITERVKKMLDAKKAKSAKKQ